MQIQRSDYLLRQVVLWDCTSSAEGSHACLNLNKWSRQELQQKTKLTSSTATTWHVSAAKKQQANNPAWSVHCLSLNFLTRAGDTMKIPLSNSNNVIIGYANEICTQWKGLTQSDVGLFSTLLPTTVAYCRATCKSTTPCDDLAAARGFISSLGRLLTSVSKIPEFSNSTKKSR